MIFVEVICCQYDFRRIGTGGCSYLGTESVGITEQNIVERATTLADQYRKKGQLFKTNVVLVPLGEDFRWNWDSEWQAHHSNYIKLFNFMNNKTEWNMKVKFGTLEDYFTAVHRSIKKEDIKTLSGDFFTYADHDDHYWSGYYTSRPFYKHMDRTVQHYVRAADIAYASWQWKTKASRTSVEDFPGILFYDLLVTARRHLSVFQHHDGVTGTAKNDVVVDYAKKMLEAIQNCQKVIAAAANALSETPIKSETESYKVDEIYTFDKLPTKNVIDKIGKTITLFNSLPYDRQELVCIIVPEKTYGISAENEEIQQEIYPFISLQNAAFDFSNNLKLCFIAKVSAFAFKSFKIIKKEDQKMAAISANFNVNISNFKVDVLPQSAKDEQNKNVIELNNNQMKVSVNPSNGYIQSINLKDDENSETKIDLHFIKYGARGRQANWTSPEANSVSGPYLFLPDGPANPLNLNSTQLLYIKGVLKQQIFAKHTTVIPLLQTITLKKDDNFVEIQNLVDIRSTADFELGMRLKTNVNGDNFFTDLNAYQMIRRRRFKEKLPIQAHFYPMPSSAFIEDESQRITLLGRQAAGVASLEPGWLEVMLDRRLTNDDDRGLNQGINDNLLTQSTFLLSIEKFVKSPQKAGDDTTVGYHSLPSQHASLRLHSPIIIMESETGKSGFSLLKSSLPCDIYTLSLRPLSAPTIYSEPDKYKVSPTDSAAIILQRFGTECGLKTSMPVGTSCPMDSSTDSTLSVNDYFTINPTELQSISLTMLYEGEKTEKIELEPMEIKSLKIKF
uniref:Alpha-mannosidase n=1 Tax=Panagrolaimus sp. ES5 TaxID=591445 RepID=A0AC34F0L8_9BILA